MRVVVIPTTPSPQPSPARAGEGALDPAPVEFAASAGAVALQRAALADGVRTLEDPVLPGREAAEDAGFHRLRPGEAKVRLHSGHRVGREARALLEEDAHFILPIDVVEDKRHETELVGLIGSQRLAHRPSGLLDLARLAEKSRAQPRQ